MDQNKSSLDNQKHKHKHLLIKHVIIYTLLLILRCIACTFPGYIHPDEFFQGGQELFYGRHRHRHHDEGGGTTDTNLNGNGYDNVRVLDLLGGVEEKRLLNSIGNSEGMCLGSLDTTNATFHKDSTRYFSFKNQHYDEEKHVEQQKQQQQQQQQKQLHHWNSRTTFEMILLETIGLKDVNITATWEFQHEHAIRSIIPPLLMTYLPLRCYQYVLKDIFKVVNKKKKNVQKTECDHQLNGYEIWIIPRLFMAFISILTVDVSLWYILKTCHTKNADADADAATTTCTPSKMNSISSKQDSKSNIYYKNTNTNNEIQRIQVNVTTLQQLNVYASSWSTLLFLNRPFSNTMETFLVALLLRTVINAIMNEIYMMKKKIDTTGVKIGCLCSLGLFTRFTFVIFAFPIVITYIHLKACIVKNKVSLTTSSPSTPLAIAPSSSSPRLNIKTYCQQFIKTSLFILVGFVVVSFVIINLDTAFYTLQEKQLQLTATSAPTTAQARIFITPWNAFRYNSKTSNLSDHGIHPRLTHCVVNMPIIFGPLAILSYVSFMKRIKGFIFAQQGTTTTTTTNTNTNTTVQNDKTTEAGIVNKICCAVMIFGLGILSLAPHQEPRFLLPLLVPIMILHAKSILWTATTTTTTETETRQEPCSSKESDCSRSMRWNMIYSWIILNFILFIFFGRLHQGGVIPSLLKLSELEGENHNTSEIFGAKEQSTAGVIYYHTYMPPTFLLRQTLANTQQDEEGQSSIKSLQGIFLDLKGRDDLLEVSTKNILSFCQNDDQHLFLVAPPVAIDSEFKHGGSGNEEEVGKKGKDEGEVSCGFSTELLCRKVWSYYQISTEDMPSLSDLDVLLSGLRLDLIYVKCR